MKLFKIRGGVHPQDRKGLSAHLAIEDLPLPPLLHIPMQQHIGAPATPAVRRGDRVAKGQLLAYSQGAVSAPVHAPTSGRVMGIGSFPAHHASGLSVRTITLQPDGEDRWSPDLAGVADPFAVEPDEIAARVSAAGIVGLGGATFPSAVKLKLHKRYKLNTLVINGAECEPYLTCDDRLMREYPDQVLDGIRIMAHALGVARIVIGIENNKPEAQAAMSAAIGRLGGTSPHPGPLPRGGEGGIGSRIPATSGQNCPHPGPLPRGGEGGVEPLRGSIALARLPTRYPMGSEKHLVQAVTGRETPARGLTADIGVVVHNPATAFAVHEALRLGRPLVYRIVTVTGGAIANPKNLRVPLGTPVAALIDHCGGFSQEPARLVSGGPMMGQPLPSTRVPMVKGSNGVLALTAAEVHARDPMPCIRCASCVSACPCGLLPLDMAAHARTGDLEGALKLGLLDCISCGSCSYVCPAHIPLVQYFNFAKGEMAARDRAKQKQAETKRLAESRTARIEAIQAAKREAMARRKREAAAAAPADAQAVRPQPAEAQA